MLLLSTMPGSRSLLNVALHMLTSMPSSVDEAVDLIKLVPPDDESIGRRIRLATELSKNFEFDLAGSQLADFHSILAANNLSKTQAEDYVKCLTNLKGIKTALSAVEKIYSKNTVAKNCYSIIAWEHYHKKGNYKKALELMERDYRENRLSKNWLLKLATEFALNNSFDIAEKLVCKAYEKIRNLRGGFAYVGWRLFPTYNLVQAQYFFQKDEESHCLKQKDICKYAVLLSYKNDFKGALKKIDSIESNSDKAKFGNHIAALCDTENVDRSLVDFSIGILKEVMSEKRGDVNIVGNLVRHYDYNEETEKCLKLVSKWENSCRFEHVFLPRVLLAVNRIRKGDMENSKFLLRNFTADQMTDQRSLLLYLICRLFNGKEDELKRSIALLYEKYPAIFVNSPRRCLMFSLVAFKFRNLVFFRRCIEIGKVYKNLYKKLFPWILKSLREIAQTEMKLPPFQLHYPINE